MKPEFEVLIQGVLETGYGVVDHFLEPGLAGRLRHRLSERLQNGEMRPAGIGRQFSFERNLKVRGDLISWLEAGQGAAEDEFLQHVDAFIAYLNDTCYTGINASEFHYAHYEAGSFYGRHRDQFKSDQGRKFSLVTYLNEDWMLEDGGCLVLYPPNEPPVQVLPLSGRAVFFRSDELEHEVQIGHRSRMSIAGWLKRI